MKKFRSRWELLQRLSAQRRKLAELDVLRARTALSETSGKELAIQQELQANADVFANLTAEPVSAHYLVACRLVTEQCTEQLAALHTERESRQQELHKLLTAWRQRSVEVDQTDQLTQRERQVYDAEQLASEQIEVDEHSMALHRNRKPRSEEMS